MFEGAKRGRISRGASQSIGELIGQRAATREGWRPSSAFNGLLAADLN